MTDISRRRFLEESAVAGAGLTAAATLEPLSEAAAADQDKAPPPTDLRLCRYQRAGLVNVALYFGDHVVDLHHLGAAFNAIPPLTSRDLLEYLPPEGKSANVVAELAAGYAKLTAADQAHLRTPVRAVKLLVPIPEPKKVILL